MNEEYLTKSCGIFEIRGAAGAGKTYQLCRDMEYLSNLGKKGVVISFSNTAVNELSERSSNNDHFKRTIHSFCWYVLSSIRMRILKSNSLKGLFVPEAFNTSKKPLDFDSQTVNEIVYGSEEKAYPFYDEKNKTLGLSHDDVIKFFSLTIDNFPELTRLISNSIDFILIDEYQDTNIEFLKRIFQYLSPKILIGIYGDPLQSVYSEKRSRISQFGFSVEQQILPENHRSMRNVVNFLNELRHPFDGLRQSTSLDGGLVEMVVSDDELDASMTRAIGQDYHFVSGKSMVLSLTNFYKTNVFDFGMTAKYVKNEVLPQLTGSKVQWSEVTNLERLNSRLKMLLKYLDFEFSTGYDAAQSLLDIYTPESVSSVDISKISQAKADVDKTRTTLVQALSDLGLVCRTGWDGVLSVVQQLQPEILENIFQFYHVLGRVDEMSRTISSAKGQEFENVILNIDSNWDKRNWNRINFNLSESDKSTENDMLNYLMYVGASRARKRLVIFVNGSNEKAFLKKFHNQFSDILIKKISIASSGETSYQDWCS